MCKIVNNIYPKHPVLSSAFFIPLTGETKEDELDLFGECPKWGEQVLHCDWAPLALCGLPLQDPGVRGGG